MVAFLANSAPSHGGALNLKYGEYCQFVKTDETVYKLEWGKNDIRNLSVMTFDTSEISQCNLVAETDEFVVLKIAGRAGTRKSIIMPLTRKSPEIHYNNAICVDLENKLIIIENPSKDSVLIVEDFINKKKMVIGKGFIPCRDSFPHKCIDSLVFNSNNLSFRWITPDKRQKDKKIEFKEFKINLQ
jgi:hypothetical protein